MGINLLPESETIKSVSINKIIKRSATAILCSILLVASAAVYLSVKINVTNSEFKKLESKFKDYTELQRAVKGLDQDLTFLNGEATLITEKLSRRLIWSEKLLILAQIMPEAMWLKTITANKQNEMHLKGLLLPLVAERRPLAILSDFIKQLKEDQGFFMGFSEISLVDVKTIKANEREILEFNILIKAEQ